MHRAGSSLDEIAVRLFADGLGPIDVYKALLTGTDSDYITAKSAMHRNLSQSAKATAQKVWDEIEALLNEDDSTAR